MKYNLYFYIRALKSDLLPSRGRAREPSNKLNRFSWQVHGVVSYWESQSRTCVVDTLSRYRDRGDFALLRWSEEFSHAWKNKFGSHSNTLKL